ncbi:CPBP family glutamic-type intramembrane protease [Nonomuraea cavernae]|uniref:CAAX prenyl protease 2/Lysostaphin resistance protein A-like domain-containing protein n=1 Tax=Nonomuraea cavernae TaxID=2045107 RepID=A0A917ZJ04_9ACTN|nr:CPBP family glutamic-type intramembrane protease [Nonomuraea cavernae]MCA2190992.1 CPBP family intramembrane metalloprotease [Nonomuraea cavernae]GGO83663.1 hypothetical protein GCM10012289_77600 [Nonomuraea cavernae]
MIRRPSAVETATSLPAFFVLLFVVAVPFWVVGAFTGHLPGVPMRLPVSALMFPGPLLVAVFLLRRRESGATRLLLRRAFAPRRLAHPAWLTATFLLVPGIALLGYALDRAMGGASSQGLDVSILAVPPLFALFFAAAVAEEAGWTGFALDPLRARWGDLGAALVLGVVWGSWHLVPLVQAGRTPGWIAWWALGTVGARLVMVRLYVATGGSVLSAVLLHTMLNLTQSLLPGYTADTSLIAAVAVVTAITGVLSFLWPRRAGRAVGRPPRPSVTRS